MKQTIRILIITIHVMLVLMLSGCQKENTSPDPKDIEEIFHFVALEDGLEVSMKLLDEHYIHVTPSLQYSLDGRNWDDFIAGQSVITLPKSGDKLYMKANGLNTAFALPTPDPECPYIANFYSFKFSKKTKVCGNIMYLLDSTHPENADMDQYAFCCLFLNDTLLVDASELLLPAQRLSEACYSEMFENTSISKGPELPATELTTDCYASMFARCSNLKFAPELPATKLDTSCYNGMFCDCSLLSSAPKLPAKQLAVACYCNMFEGCTSLTAAPELPASQLVTWCYYRMFEGCSSMVSLTCMGTDLSAKGCIGHWMDKITTIGTLHAAAGTDWTGKIPDTWTVEY